mmetsp:Transcript_11072/g.33907  ORF Transcript_11072/g.33907 Transcript_11072/m.33907 type:complete len:465 (-) Transcript_11072:169-1563(-)
MAALTPSTSAHSLVPDVLVILGTTGAGKTQLSVELALRFRGEVINCDVMQMYQGLDIVTNKATPEEMSGIPHHMLGFLDPLRVPSTSYTVQEFVRDATQLIGEIHARRRLPILVGGTHYYMESLLWHSVLPSPSSSVAAPSSMSSSVSSSTSSSSPTSSSSSSSSALPVSTTASSSCTSQPTRSLDTSIYARLQAVDPVRAAQLHPNDERKLLRSLEVFEQTGIPHSELLQTQEQRLRYRACFLWPRAEKPVLNTRLDTRVDQMIERGLMSELEAFVRQIPASIGDPWQCNAGIFQAIGFKEFGSYFASEHARDPTQLARCVDAIKANTRRYAKKQLKWIRHRIIDRRRVAVYAFDTTDASANRWAEQVAKPSQAIVQAFLDQTLADCAAAKLHTWVPESGNSGMSASPTSALSGVALRECPLCHKYLRGEQQWIQHCRTRSHRRLAQKRKHQQQTADGLPQKR